MPEKMIVDPANIPKSKIATLISFFNDTKRLLYPQSEIYNHPNIGDFSFTESIVAWSSNATSSGAMHFEVFDKTRRLARGGQATVYASKGTLLIGDDHISFSDTFPRVIKVGPESHFSLVERELHQLDVSFNCLPLTIVGETAYFIMKKVPGVTLAQLLNNNALSIEQRFMLAIDIIDAVHRIAKNDIHHCDIKPQNIMVYFPGKILHVCIIDFGLAKFAKRPSGDARQAEGFEGTVAFAPPERYDNIITNNSDVYSVAMVLALIFGAVLKTGQADRELIPQGMEYAKRMDYTNTLFVVGLPQTTLTQLESVFTQMSFVEPTLRIDLTTARDKLIGIGLSLDAGLHTTKTKRQATSLKRVASCWLRKNDDRKVHRQSSSVLSVHSDEEPYTGPSTIKTILSYSDLSPDLLFFPATTERSPGLKPEPKSPGFNYSKSQN